jgi:hypothetical protein
MAAQTDFWGEIQVSEIRTPASILREQAALLGPKTQNVIEARVETAVTADDKFAHAFYLVAPGLDNYRYRLLQITHPIGLYPVISPPHVLKTEEEFTAWLHKKLSSDQTRRIVANLLAQARG